MPSNICFLPNDFVQFRAESSGVDVENRMVKLIASDETYVERFSWERWEPYMMSLSHDPKHVDLERVKTKVAMFFDGHPGGFFSTSNRLGKIMKAGIENKQLAVEVKLNKSDQAERYLEDVQDQVEPGNSVGIQVNKIEVVQKAKYESGEDGRKRLVEPMKVRAIDWTLLELSAVDIPANPNANKLSNEDREKFDKMPKHVVEIIGDEEDFAYFVSSKVNLDNSDNPQTPEKSIMGTEENQSRVTELSDKNRELQVQLANSEKEKTQLLEKLAAKEISEQYFRLRAHATDLYMSNHISEEDLRFDFTDDTEEDLKRFTELDSETAKLDLKGIERSLRRASLKKPIEKVKKPEDKTLLSNNELKSKEASIGTGERPAEIGSEDQLAQEKEAEEFVANRKVRRIG